MPIPLVLLGLVTLTATPERYPAQARPAADTTVVVKAFGYRPKVLEIAAGTTVTWVNQDDIQHTVTLEAPDSAVALDASLSGKGSTSQFTFTRAGTYAYLCARHQFMRGTVRVHDTGVHR